MTSEIAVTHLRAPAPALELYTANGLGAATFLLGCFFFDVPGNGLLRKIDTRKTTMRSNAG